MTAHTEKGADKGRAEDWLNLAYETLVRSGVEAVKIQPLAKAMNTSRTSFYWFFKDRDALLSQLIERWKNTNTQGLVGQTERYAENVMEAMLNVFDCWLEPKLFDADFEYAVRHWALQSSDVADAVAEADERRLAALRAMLKRYDYPDGEADVRARTIYLTQIGYISMRTQEDLSERLSRMAEYVRVFTGRTCTDGDLARFVARHHDDPKGWLETHQSQTLETWLADR
ncbi:TetR family transcriptional regulator [Saccharospirillum sp. MSK14-1]|uniref:TetR/AcrR family transcriptional regulator n=1 Tax=Saccharospirillum sp. MSK14-1 TaxID=1897632 RepID=UPI000D3CEEDC|nr:TetR/AcrR family transcriptional regulator [Saccharospirillum sp. MSK14-1]PTY37956.1 TetR family transcriptional regulator [Saccharospirillum sp. MSK14-1]